MNLQESIRRILKEEIKIPVSARRRVDLSDEKIKRGIKNHALRIYKFHGVDTVFLHLVFDNVTSDLLAHLNEEMYEETYPKLFSYIKEKYSDFLSEYVNKTFEKDEVRKFCFIKHSERWGGRGFTDCWDSWSRLLNKNGSYVPDVEWDVVKKKLDELPVGQELLISRPNENTYGYYFSVYKKT